MNGLKTNNYFGRAQALASFTEARWLAQKEVSA